MTTPWLNSIKLFSLWVYISWQLYNCFMCLNHCRCRRRRGKTRVEKGKRRARTTWVGRRCSTRTMGQRTLVEGRWATGDRDAGTPRRKAKKQHKKCVRTTAQGKGPGSGDPKRNEVFSSLERFSCTFRTSPPAPSRNSIHFFPCALFF